MSDIISNQRSARVNNSQPTEVDQLKAEISLLKQQTVKLVHQLNALANKLDCKTDGNVNFGTNVRFHAINAVKGKNVDRFHTLVIDKKTGEVFARDDKKTLLKKIFK